MRLAIVAGEASGDALGARVVHSLRETLHNGPGEPVELTVEGVGGEQLVAAGCRSLFPIDTLSVMGLVDPLKRLPRLLGMRRDLVRHFAGSPPDVFLGIDSPDFNLSLAAQLRQRNIPTAHLVSPSVWAWRRGRMKGIRRAVDHMFCLFPFEAAPYRDAGVSHEVVGHPMADDVPDLSSVTAAREALHLGPGDKVVALLPGSRIGEIRSHGALFLDVARALLARDDQLSFVLPLANDRCEQALRPALEASGLPVKLVRHDTQLAIAAADVVLVASGTATLETALIKRPMVVAYRMGKVSWAVISRLVKTEHIALPNLLSGRSIVPEFLQAAATPQALADALWQQLHGDDAYESLMASYRDIHSSLAAGLRCARGDQALRNGRRRSNLNDWFAIDFDAPGMAGVDEVGRGPLAGDVVAAAVILDPDSPVEGLRDSKRLTHERRVELAAQIRERALGWAIARASVEEIDRINILQASLLAMRRAVESLQPQPDCVLVDGNRLPQWSYRAEAVVKGDDKVPAIAAASILAKVQRDQELVALDQRYPGYGFAGHKGYPTKAHLAALQSLGVTPVHRRSFAPVKKVLGLA